MFILKACPYCCGDLSRQSNGFGPYIGCLQCGYILRAEEELRLFRQELEPPEPAKVELSKPGAKLR